MSETEREHLKGYHVYLTVSVGRVNLYSVKPHGGNSGAWTALSAITCSHSHKQDLQPPIYTISLTGTFPNNNRWSPVGWKQNTTLHLRDHAHWLLFLCLQPFSLVYWLSFAELTTTPTFASVSDFFQSPVNTKLCENDKGLKVASSDMLSLMALIHGTPPLTTTRYSFVPNTCKAIQCEC